MRVPLHSAIATVVTLVALTAVASAAPQHPLVLPRLVNGNALNNGSAAGVPNVKHKDIGRASSMMPIDIAITLRYRNEAELNSLIEAQSDPSSPLFEHFLTPEQFIAQFALDITQYDAVLSSLQRSGFRIRNTYSNRTVIDATAPVMTIERYFNTEIHSVEQPDHGTRYMNARPAIAPPDVRAEILHIDGLNNLVLLHSDIANVKTHPLRTPPAASTTAAALGQASVRPAITGPIYGPVSSFTGLAGYSPGVFAAAYDLPLLHGYNGAGRTSGIAIDADYLDSDLSGFLNYFNIQRTGPATTRVLIDGGPPIGDGSPDSVEATLDVEQIVSLAPGTNLYVYEFPSFANLSYITDTYNAAVAQDKVDTLNSSFGGCEMIDPGVFTAWDQIAAQGAAEGITFHASSGDAGAKECYAANFPIGVGLSAPADAQHFVAVGGTALYVNTTGDRFGGESGWLYSGGGVSLVFPIPQWQRLTKNVIVKGRNDPDVSFDADPDTGAAYYYGGTWNTVYNPVGGTSLSSPIFGAAITEIDQLKQRRTGLAGKLLTQFWQKYGYGTTLHPYFYDALSGFNLFYWCQPGYDRVTGIGSVDVWNVGQSLSTH